MKIILKNSSLVFAKALVEVPYNETGSKYLNTNGTVGDSQYSSNYVTDELVADNYIVSGCFAPESNRLNVAWYDSNHNFISGLNLTEGTSSTAKQQNVQLQKPLNASYVRIATVYAPSVEDFNLKLKVSI